MTQPGKVLYIIVCAAGPAPDVGRLVTLAQDAGWTVQIIATPPALDFINIAELEKQTGRPVRSQYRNGAPRSAIRAIPTELADRAPHETAPPPVFARPLRPGPGPSTVS
ncbi:hypothetical protein [Nonomuraea sp. KM88]|uniref:hypothetical protein n=1 Tax=Nonomuraea sp. KM88 TaxID=3457427 RepID=UPI003FCCDC2B